MNELVTVITPAYNAERFIVKTIQSVQDQTYQNWEHLVVIDCNSKDSTEKLVQEISAKDPRVKCIKSPKALGAANNRNVGIDLAKGVYLAFLDADDLWTPDKLEKQIGFMQKNNYDFTFTAFTRISEDSQKTGSFLQVPSRVNYTDLLKDNRIGCLTAVIKKSAFKDIFFEETGWEDLNLWLHLLKQTQYAYGINESLAYYRIVNGSRSNNKLYSAGRKWDTFRKVEKMNLISSIYYFTFYAISGLRKHSQF